MSTKVFRIESSFHRREQFPIIEIDNGKVFRIESSFHRREQFPIIEIDGLYSMTDAFVILQQTGLI